MSGLNFEVFVNLKNWGLESWSSSTIPFWPTPILNEDSTFKALFLGMTSGCHAKTSDAPMTLYVKP